MLNLNLLPPEIKLKHRQAKTSVNVFGLCLVAIIVVAILFVLLYEYKINVLQVKLNNSNAAVASANSTLSPLKELASNALAINDRADIAKPIEAKRATWSVIISELINSVPSDVQFTNVVIDSSKKPNFVLQGNTTSEREAVKFRDKLEDSAYFQNVAFQSSSTGQSTEPGAPAQTLNFTLQFDLKRLTPETTTKGGS